MLHHDQHTHRISAHLLVVYRGWHSMLSCGACWKEHLLNLEVLRILNVVWL
jgi:hypothetical protein